MRHCFALKLQKCFVDCKTSLDFPADNKWLFMFRWASIAAGLCVFWISLHFAWNPRLRREPFSAESVFFFFYLSETRAGLPVEWSSHVMNALFLSLSLWQEKPAWNQNNTFREEETNSGTNTSRGGSDKMCMAAIEPSGDSRKTKTEVALLDGLWRHRGFDSTFKHPVIGCWSHWGPDGANKCPPTQKHTDRMQINSFPAFT